jgi:hypothetical protein
VIAPAGFDAEAAAKFVEGARSRFCKLAVEWLVTWDDPVDVLFMLSGETGQAFGPWETYRFCALLGLTPADPVKELGLDVLVEPLNAMDKTPPLAHAGALAQAIATLGGEAPYAEAVLDALEGREMPGVPPVMMAAATLGLASQIGDPRAGAAAALVAAELREERTPWAVPCLEAAMLAGDEALIEAGRAALVRAQEADGSVFCDHTHPTLKALVTLRALCFFKPLIEPGADAGG